MSWLGCPLNRAARDSARLAPPCASAALNHLAFLAEAGLTSCLDPPRPRAIGQVLNRRLPRGSVPPPDACAAPSKNGPRVTVAGLSFHLYWMSQPSCLASLSAGTVRCELPPSPGLARHRVVMPQRPLEILLLRPRLRRPATTRCPVSPHGLPSRLPPRSDRAGCDSRRRTWDSLPQSPLVAASERPRLAATSRYHGYVFS